MTTPQVFAHICGIPPQQTMMKYHMWYGNNVIYKCRVPKNHLLLSFTFNPDVANTFWAPIGKFSVFEGLYSYNNVSEAMKIIET